MTPIKVLFVDDDLFFSSITVTALQKKGYQVNCLHSTVGLLDIIKQSEPDIILLDVEIGNEDGISIVPEIQLIVPNTPILFMSSHTESCEVQRALEKGAITYLMKPFDPEILIAHVERHAQQNASASISIGMFTLNPHTHILYMDDTEIKRLSKLEFDLLTLLYSHKNQLVSLEDIRSLWRNTPMNEHSLYNYISKLRKLLSTDKRLSLISGSKGYVLQISS